MRKRKPTRVLALSLLWLAAPRVEPACGAEDQQVILLESEYSVDGHAIGTQRRRRIILAVALDGAVGHGMLGLDANRCQLNEFGDPVSCTEMATTWQAVALRQRELRDPMARHRQLYDLIDHDLGVAATLVVPSTPAEHYRLVIDAPERIVITLEPAPEGSTRRRYPWPPTVPEQVGDELSLRAVFEGKNLAVINGHPLTIGDTFQVGDTQYELVAVADRQATLRAWVIGADGSRSAASNITLKLARR